MKIKKAKFVVGSMLATCSLAIVGSITSTFAWYTYNTKTTLAYSGLAGGDTSNLQMKFDSDDSTKWRSSITIDELINYSKSTNHAGGTLSPVTLKNTTTQYDDTNMISDSSFYGPTSALNPSFNVQSPKDKDGNYLWLSATIQFRCMNPGTSELIKKELYVSYLGAKVNSTTNKDITKGLRINFRDGSAKNWLVAPGYTENGVTNLYGPLNLSDNSKDWGVWTTIENTEDGYFDGNDFYTTIAKTEKINPTEGKIYRDRSNANKVYYHNGSSYSDVFVEGYKKNDTFYSDETFDTPINPVDGNYYHDLVLDEYYQYTDGAYNKFYTGKYLNNTYCDAFLSQEDATNEAQTLVEEGVTFTAKEHFDAGIYENGKYRSFITGYDDPKNLETVQYGVKNATESYYGTNNFVTQFDGGKIVQPAKVKLGETKDSPANFFTLFIYIFLEGWDPAVIDQNHAGDFDIGIQFETEI